MKSLDGKVAIITGAGREKGMGQATARKLAQEGAKVCIADICRSYEPGLGEFWDSAVGGMLGTMDHLEKVVEEIGKGGGQARAFAADVTKKEEVESLVDSTVQEFGRVDILVNAVGTGVGAGNFLEIEENAWRKGFDVNVMGSFYLMRAVIPEMIKVGGGRIVNISSLAGLRGVKEYGAYVATKFSQVGMTQTVASELGPQNITVNAVCPGFVDTKMGDDEAMYTAMVQGCTEEDYRERVINAIPLRRYGTAEDVANVIYFLVSPLADYVTGQSIVVAGGVDFADPIFG